MKFEVILLEPRYRRLEGTEPIYEPVNKKTAEAYLSDFLGLDMGNLGSFEVFCKRYGRDALEDILKDANGEWSKRKSSLDAWGDLQRGNWRLTDEQLMRHCSRDVEEAQLAVRLAIEEKRPWDLDYHLELHTKVGMDWCDVGNRRYCQLIAVGNDAIGAACLAAGILLDDGMNYRDRGLVCDSCGLPLPESAKLSTCEKCRDKAMRSDAFFKAKRAAYRRVARMGITNPEHERHLEFCVDWEAIHNMNSLEKFKVKWGLTRGPGRPSRERQEDAN